MKVRSVSACRALICEVLSAILVFHEAALKTSILLGFNTMKRRNNLELCRRDLPIADAVAEAIVRLRELTLLEANTRLAPTERRALQSAIRELKIIIQRNVF